MLKWLLDSHLNVFHELLKPAFDEFKPEFLGLPHRLKILEMQILDQMFQNPIGFGMDVINIITAWR